MNSLATSTEQINPPSQKFSDIIPLSAGHDGASTANGPQAETQATQPAAAGEPTPDERRRATLAAALEIVMPPGTTTEVMIFEAEEAGDFINKAHRFPKTFGGYFDASEKILDLAPRWRTGTYFVLNGVDPDLLPVSSNRIRVFKEGDGATNDNVPALRFLQLDWDADKPPALKGKKVSSTDQEMGEALHRTAAALDAHPGMERHTLYGCSGNGGYAWVKIKPLPNDAKHRQIVADTVDYFSDHFGADRTTKNPARLAPLPSTPKRKGDSTPDRPHRWVTVDPRSLERFDRDSNFDLLAFYDRVVKPWKAAQPREGAAQHAVPAIASAPRVGSNHEEAWRRATAYLDTVDPAIQGDEGSDACLYAAAQVGVGFALTEGETFRLLWERYNPRCVPPWSEHDLRRKVSEGFKKEKRTPGWLLDAPRPGRDQAAQQAPAAGKADGKRGRKAKAEESDEGGHGRPIYGGSGGLTSCAHNSRWWLTTTKDAGWACYDTFRRRVLVGGLPLTDQAVIDLALEIEEATETPWSQEHVRSAILHLAHQNEFSSLVEYLDGLQWDGVERIEHFFTDHYSVDQTPYHAEVGRVLFLSAVARAYQPGCKVDTVPLLIGGQGCGKSRGVEALVPETDWYSDDLGNDMFSGRAGEGLQAKWLVELAELARVNRSTVEVVKSFISRKVDHYRPPYGRIAMDFPRTCIFVATTNSDDPLEDTENRRYLPVWVKDADPTRIAEARDQLWAEAVHRYKAGDKWWTTRPNLVAEMRQQVGTARKTDAWEGILSEQLDGREQTTMVDAARMVGITPDKLTRSEQVRIGNALKMLGFCRKRQTEGLRLWFYERIPSQPG